jgi:hypothetical protein
MMTTTDKLNEATYQKRYSDVCRLLDVLDMELPARHESGDWRNTHDMAHVRERLVELVAFVSGNEPERVREFLAD